MIDEESMKIVSWGKNILKTTCLFAAFAAVICAGAAQAEEEKNELGVITVTGAREGELKS